MVLKIFDTEVLEELCSQDHLDLVDAVDTLRSQGVSHYVSLPQIIVCGDQSSGKSSVLEAISGVSFPVNSTLCTRFPTELILRKTSYVGQTISIVPDQSRSKAEKRSLENFREQLDSFEELPRLIELAKTAMGVSTDGRGFAKDLLRVEISGPNRPQLTIVDLPGLIHSETKQQSASDVETVKQIVRDYMRQPRSVILAVLSAKNDYANQVVLSLARAADKNGNRTLGVITKPDTLVAGSSTEAMFVSLAKNQQIEFRLGWHVLKNMDSEVGKSSLAVRNAEEYEFFLRGVWKDMPRSLLGIEELRLRLSKVLLRQISLELPSLVNEIKIKTEDCQSQVDKLGLSRATLDEQRAYLIRCSQSCQSLIKAAVDGTYNDAFFEDAQSENGYRQRIRAVMQNLNGDFAKRISSEGHQYIIGETLPSGQSARPDHQQQITNDAFIERVQVLIKHNRGRELPGSFNPMIVGDLFREQSIPWEQIAHDHIETAWEAISHFLSEMMVYVCDGPTEAAVQKLVVMPAIDNLMQDLTAKTTELLLLQRGHPITYNDSFTEAVQKFRHERGKEEFSQIVMSFFGVSSLVGMQYLNQQRDLNKLVENLSTRAERDLQRSACLEAMDCMQAYYQVSLKRFIDDIAVEVIEAKLIAPLIDIFSPSVVVDMAPDIVKQIAGEGEEVRLKREQLGKQLETLMQGMKTCQQFMSGDNFDSSMYVVDRQDDSDVSNLENTIEDMSLASPPLAPEVLEPEPLSTDDLGWGPSIKKSKKKKKGKSLAEDNLHQV